MSLIEMNTYQICVWNLEFHKIFRIVRMWCMEQSGIFSGYYVLNHLHKGLLLLSIYHFNPLNSGFFFFCYILYPYLSATLWKTGEGIFMNFLEDVCNKGHITVLVTMEGQLGLQCCFSDIKNASLISKINFWYQKFLNFWYQKIIFWYKKSHDFFSIYDKH